MATAIFDDIKTEAIKPPPSLHKIGLHMAMMHNVNISDVKNGPRKKILVDVRQSIARKAHDEGYSYEDIAKYLGHKDHTTVLHYLNKRP